MINLNQRIGKGTNMKIFRLKRILSVVVAAALVMGTMDGYSVNAFATDEILFSSASTEDSEGGSSASSVVAEASTEVTGPEHSATGYNTIDPYNPDSSSTGAGTPDNPDIIIIDPNAPSPDAANEASSDASSEASSDSSSEASSDASSDESSEELPEDYYTEYPTGVRGESFLDPESVSDGAIVRRRLLRGVDEASGSRYITSNLPALRRQSPYGTCWAFATTALAEINIMKKYGGSVDFSELHLAYFTYNTVVDPLGGTEGDYYNYGASKENLDQGGRVEYGLTTFAKWMGVADEETAHYKNDIIAATSGGGLNPIIAYDDVAHVTNYYVDPITKNSDEIAASKHQNIKRLIVDHGAVAIEYGAINSMAAATDESIYNDKTYAYYNPVESQINHAVVVVGWDDDFSKENFAQTPPGDGAFLVRNSWSVGNGTDVDDNMGYAGYFWMSYYEATLGYTAIAADFRLAEDNENIYEYDGGLTSISSSYSKAANVFTAHAEGGANGEILNAVSFETMSSNVQYTIDIYTGLEDLDNPESGPRYVSLEGTTTYAGFYTVDLPKPLKISAGNTFSVVVSLTKEGSSLGISQELAYGNEPSEVHAGEGQSFYFDNQQEKWVDVAYNGHGRNFVIKAYTTNNLDTDTLPEDIEIIGLDDNGELTIGLGENPKVPAKVLPATAANQSLEWSSSDPSVATVSPSGKIATLAIGTTEITVNVSGTDVARRFTVNVIPKLLGLKIYRSSTGAADKFTLHANPVPESYVSSERVVWSTSTPELLELDSYTGEAKILKPGLIYYTATLEGISKTESFFEFPNYDYIVNDDYSVTFEIEPVQGVEEYRLVQGNRTVASVMAEAGIEKYILTDDTYAGRDDATGTFKIRLELSDSYAEQTVKIPLYGAYNINYVVGNGTLSPDSPKRYIPGQEKSLYNPTPTVAGTFFEGWYLDPEFKGDRRYSILKSDTGDLTFYAKYSRPKRRVYFYVMNMITEQFGSFYTYDEVENGDTVAPAEITKDGYCIEGWYLDQGLTRKFDFNTPITYNLDLYAKWVVPPVVTFDLGNGRIYKKVNVAIDDAVEEPEEPTKPGCLFLGWYTDFELTQEYDFSQSVTDSFTLYAKWSKPSTGLSIYQYDGNKLMNKDLEVIETGSPVILTAVAEPEGSSSDGSYTWKNYGTEEDSVYADIHPIGAATAEVNDDGDLVINPIKTGTIRVTAISSEDEALVATKLLSIKEILPQSIKISAENAGTANKNAYAFAIDSTLKLTYRLYNDKNPGENSSLSASQDKVVFTSSDEGIAAISAPATETVTGVDGKEIEQGYVIITPGEKATELINSGAGGSDGPKYVTAHITAASTANDAVHAEFDVIVKSADMPEDGEIELPELQIISSAKNPKIYASTDSEREVDEIGIELATGKSETVKALLLNAPVDKSIVWSSANPAVVTVNNKGVIAAKSAGEVVVTANSPATGLTAAVRVKVYDPVSSFAIDKKSINMGFGQTSFIEVTTLLPTSASDEITVKAINNAAIESVEYEGNGRIRIVAKESRYVNGKTTKGAIILATAHGEKTASCNITVGNAVESITVSARGVANGITPFVAAGKTLQFQATFNNGDKKNQPVNKEVIWKIAEASDEDVATINNKGLLTAKKEGWVSIVATSTTDYYGAEPVSSDPDEMTVMIYVPVKKASLSANGVTLSTGKEYTVGVNIIPAVADAEHATGSKTDDNGVIGYGDVADEVVWKIKNAKDLGTLEFRDNTTGEFTSEGSEKGDANGSFVGKELTFKVNPDLNITRNVVVPVTASFRPYGAKKDTILTFNVTITNGLISKMALNPTKVTMNRGAETEISAVLTPIIPKDSTLTWKIADDSKGLIEFVGENVDNPYELTTGDDGEADGNGSNTVRIKAVSAVGVTAKTKATIIVATKGTDESGNKITSNGKPITAKVTVEIGNQANDIMITSGKINASLYGDADDLEAAMGSAINKGKMISLSTGKSISLKANVYTSYGTAVGDITAAGMAANWTAPKGSVKAGNQKVEWTSSDPSVATVAANGAVKAVGTGVAVITARSTDKSYDENDIATSTEGMAIVYVYESAKKLTLDKAKMAMGTSISGHTVSSSLREYDVVTAMVAPESIYDNYQGQELDASLGNFDKIAWTVDATGSGRIAVYAVDTKTIRAAKDAYSKQNMLSLYDDDFKTLVVADKNVSEDQLNASGQVDTLYTGREQSIAIKALRPGTVKLKATAPGGKTAICTITIATKIQDVMITSGKINASWDYEDVNGDANEGKAIPLSVGKSASLKATVYSYYGGALETSATAREQSFSWAAPKDSIKASAQKIVWTSSDPSVATVSASGAVKAVGNGRVVITARAADNTVSGVNAYAQAVVYVYDAATKMTINKAKTSVEVTDGNHQGQIYGNFDLVTATAMTAKNGDFFYNLTDAENAVNSASSAAQRKNLEDYRDFLESFMKITWTVDAGTSGNEIIAVAACDENVKSAMVAAADETEKQEMLAELGQYTALSKPGNTPGGVSSFTLGKGESLAIKALRPGTVKLKATEPGGKTAICTITVYTHVQNLSLKLSWDGNASRYSAPVTKTANRQVFTVLEETASETDEELHDKAVDSGSDYIAKLDLVTVKSTGMSLVPDYCCGEGEGVIPFSDKTATAAQKAATALYNNAKKYDADKFSVGKVKFVSSDTGVAMASANGTITAKGIGNAVIIMSYGEGERTIVKKVYVEVRSSSAGWFTKRHGSELPAQYLSITDYAGNSGGGLPDDGISDTVAINNAIIQAGRNAANNGVNTVYIPEGTYDITATGSWDKYIYIGPYWGSGSDRTPIGNVNIVMDEDTVLKVHPTDSDHYEVIHIELSDNISITGGQIIGERYEHNIFKLSESGHGVGIHGSTNITIDNMAISSNMSDGIYLAVQQKRNNETGEQMHIGNSQITISNCDIYDNRRNGISFTDADNVTVDNCYIYDCHGSAPQCGIYFEPNSDSSDSVCEHILIKDTTVTAYQNRNSAEYTCFMTHQNPWNHQYVTANDVTLQNCVINGYFGNYSGKNLTMPGTVINGSKDNWW